MAVEIPVVVDIEGAFKEAAKEVPTAMQPLVRQISKHQLNVQVDVGTAKHPQLRKFKDLLNESQSSATQLNRAILEVRKQIFALSKAGGFDPAKGLKSTERDLLALRAALEMKLEGGNYIKNTTEELKKLAAGAESTRHTATSAINATNSGLKTQSGLLSSITGRLGSYISIWGGLQLIKNIRNVTAEFEMQKVALAGIIQDATKANQLFAQVKAAAVQSPFEIKDLVSFTKQLSAYRIETDKLFDVTMRLADVSAGLGVDMSRLVLAYGQVRAASVLRGQELRQFTEAGIPLVDLLAKKFSVLRNEIVSTGEVFELISDRAVPFAMIEDIFNDMTSAGGIFYEMQLKQSETLKGQWMKLKDVVSIAYDEMGRGAIVNKGMIGEIKLISELIKNWERIASVVNVALNSYLAYRLALKGMIPLYNMQQKSIARQIALEKRQQIEQIRLESTHKKLTQAEKRRIAQIQKTTAEDYKRIYAMDKMTHSQAMLTYWRNKDNKEIAKAIQQTGILTQAEMRAIKGMNGLQLRLKVLGSSLRTLGTSVGTAIASFWPIALVSAAITAITDLIHANQEQVEAIKRVDKAYHEQEDALLSIDNAYKKIKQSIADISDEQDRAAKNAASFGKKLEQAQKLVEMLKKFGMGGDFDLSLLNTENIDEFVEIWIEKLHEANELTRDWGRNVAQVANAWELSVLGIHLAGDNLNTDIKQLTNAYVKMTSNKKFRRDVDDMRNYLEMLRLNHKEYYDQLTALLGEEANLAIAQKRRNETEYQYQQRLIKNYEKIREKVMFNQSFKDAGLSQFFYSMTDSVDKFEKRLNEVEREFDKTWGSLEGKDEITIKMAIDKLFAENQWEDWLKEAWIERVNQKYQMNIQVVPTIGKVDVSRGMKGIIATEFEGLFTEQELANMNTVTEIGKAIDEKMSKAAQSIKEADEMANNLANNEAWSDKTKEKIKKAQIAINEELAKDEKDRNQEAIRGAVEQIDALTKQNGLYEEQILKKKESARAEYDLAKAAKERLMSEGLSDLGKDIKQAFPGLIKDTFREMTDENYVGRFLISPDDLKNIKDGVDAYDLYAKNIKAIADEREKLAQAGVTEQTVSEEQARIDAERLAIQQQIEGIEKQIAEHNYEEVMSKYNSLRLAVQNASTAADREKAESDLQEFLGKTNIAEAATLIVEKQRLMTNLGIANAALGAQNAFANTFSAMDSAEKSWEEFAKRYNLTLFTKPKGGAGQDPWVLLFKNRMKFMQDFQKGVEDLDKYISHSYSLGREQEIMKGRGLSLGIKTEDLLGTPQELRDWYDKAIKDVVAKIRSMGGREFAGLGVTEILAKDLTGRKIQKYQELLQELWKGLTDFDTNQIKNELEKKLKKVSEEVKRSEAARNFYKDIFDLTGDETLATSLSVEVYGGIGDEFKERLQQQLAALFEGVEVDDAMRNAIDTQDFDYIFANLPEGMEKVREELKKLREDNEKFSADQIKTWVNELKKAKTYGDERVRIARTTQERIAEINRSNLKDAEKSKLVEQYARKEAEDVAKLQYEAFKDSPMYVQMFSDLDSATEGMLRTMRNRIAGLMESWKDLDPVQLKEMQSRLQEIDAQLAKKNPFKLLSDSMERYNNLMKKGRSLRGDTLKMQKTDDNLRDQQEALEMSIKRRDAAKMTADAAELMFGADSAVAVVSKQNLKIAEQAVEDQAKLTDEAKESADAAARNADEWKEIQTAIQAARTEIEGYTSVVTKLGDVVQEALSVFVSDDAANYAQRATEIFGTFADSLKNIAAAAVKAEAGDIGGVFQSAATGILGLVSAGFKIADMINQAQLDEMTKGMAEQDKIIHRLERSYDRLNTAIENCFGGDYLYNYNQQMIQLFETQEAYRKQIEEQQKVAENASRASDRDDAKKNIEELEDKIEDVGNQMDELRKKTTEFFVGTNLASAAEEFASSWLDAYREFGSTTDAIKEKMQDMINSLIVKSTLADAAKAILQPFFIELENIRDTEGFTTANIAKLSGILMSNVNVLDESLTSWMTVFQSLGMTTRGAIGSFKGIARDIAGASEESILGLAAGINTQNYYMSYVPMIHTNLEQVLALMGGSPTTPTVAPSAAEEGPAMPSVQEMIHTNLPAIQTDIAAIRQMLSDVIKPVGTTASKYVATRI